MKRVCVGMLRYMIYQQHHPMFLFAYIYYKVFIQASGLACEVYIAVSPLMGIKRFDHRTKVKARSVRQNLQTASQLCTKQVGTGEINQIIESLLKVKVQRITKTY